MDYQGTSRCPKEQPGVVVFAHGSGSSRHSPRNRYVASVLQQGGLATLLMDLLTPAEEQADFEPSQLRFNIRFLAGRLLEATEWLQRQAPPGQLPIGYFGSTPRAPAARRAPGERTPLIQSIVAR